MEVIRRLLGRRPAALLLTAWVVVTGLGLAAYSSDQLSALENESIDLRFQARGDTEVPPDIVIVEIDPQTLEAVHQPWPFNRRLHAEAISRLSNAGAAVIAYDVEFSSPRDPVDDAALAAAVDNAPAIVLATSRIDASGDPVLFGTAKARAAGVRIGDSASFEADSDGVLRKFLYEVNDIRAFAVEVAEARAEHPIGPVGFGPRGGWIDYRGPPATFPSVSFIRVLRNRVPPSTFRDKTVVVGVTDPAILQKHPVPVGRSMSGVELEANAIATVSNEMPLRDAPSWVEIMLIIGLSGVAPLCTVRFGALRATAVALLAGGLFLLADQLAFNAGHVIDTAVPLGSLMLSTLGSVGLARGAALSHEELLRRDFARFVPVEALEEVIKTAGDTQRLDGVRRYATVLCCDIRGFTEFVERTSDPLAIETLRQYHAQVDSAIRRRQGMIASYSGDGVLAAWGTELEQVDHAELAVATAKDILTGRLQLLRSWLSACGVSGEFALGIGVATGWVISGNVGAGSRIEYTVIGRAANLASRIEDATKRHRTALLISGETRRAMAQRDELRFVADERFQGIAEVTSLWTMDLDDALE